MLDRVALYDPASYRNHASRIEPSTQESFSPQHPLLDLSPDGFGETDESIFLKRRFSGLFRHAVLHSSIVSKVGRS